MDLNQKTRIRRPAALVPPRKGRVDLNRVPDAIAQNREVPPRKGRVDLNRLLLCRNDDVTVPPRKGRVDLNTFGNGSRIMLG